MAREQAKVLLAGREATVDHLDLPRLAFHHTRRQYARLRALIFRINGFAEGDAAIAANIEGSGSAEVA